jgi:hypothetical protein
MSTHHNATTEQLASMLNAVFPAVHGLSPQTEVLLDKLRAWEHGLPQGRAAERKAAGQLCIRTLACSWPSKGAFVSAL